MDEPLLCGNIVDTLDIFRKYTYLYYVRHKSAIGIIRMCAADIK